jgi:hypothetical protein
MPDSQTPDEQVRGMFDGIERFLAERGEAADRARAARRARAAEIRRRVRALTPPAVVEPEDDTRDPDQCTCHITAFPPCSHCENTPEGETASPTA